MANGFFFIFGRNWALEREETGNWKVNVFRGGGGGGGEGEGIVFSKFNTTYLLTNK